MHGTYSLMRPPEHADTNDMNLITSALFLGVLLSIAAFGRDREPSWVSRDGSRFVARARVIDERGGRPGRWMVIRGGLGAGAVVIQPGFTGSRSVAGTYREAARLDGTHRGSVLFVLRGERSIVVRVRNAERLETALDALSAQSI